MSNHDVDKDRISLWYFGGLASSGAACITHPLDLIKVHLQTQKDFNLTLAQSIKQIYTKQGILGFYNGISASLLRQLTYSTARFGAYDQFKLMYKSDTFLDKILVASAAGVVGSLFGVPFDVLNVRMQNDMKLPIDKRRNYKHIVDGLVRVIREEGPLQLFSGTTFATVRAILVTIGSMAVYDEIKQGMMRRFDMKDDMAVYLFSSLAAAVATTLMSQPIDVLKTRAMNAKPGQYSGLTHIIMDTAKTGPLTFYKGTLPTFVRIGPHLVLTFVILEQLRKRFGYLPHDQKIEK